MAGSFTVLLDLLWFSVQCCVCDCYYSSCWCCYFVVVGGGVVIAYVVLLLFFIDIGSNIFFIIIINIVLFSLSFFTFHFYSTGLANRNTRLYLRPCSLQCHMCVALQFVYATTFTSSVCIYVDGHIFHCGIIISAIVCLVQLGFQMSLCCGMDVFVRLCSSDLS